MSSAATLRTKTRHRSSAALLSLPLLFCSAVRCCCITPPLPTPPTKRNSSPPSSSSSSSSSSFFSSFSSIFFLLFSFVPAPVPTSSPSSSLLRCPFVGSSSIRRSLPIFPARRPGSSSNNNNNSNMTDRSSRSSSNRMDGKRLDTVVFCCC